jgi:hypothetical protein
MDTDLHKHRHRPTYEHTHTHTHTHTYTQTYTCTHTNTNTDLHKTYTLCVCSQLTTQDPRDTTKREKPKIVNISGRLSGILHVAVANFWRVTKSLSSLSLRSHSLYHLRPSVFAVPTHRPIPVSRCTQTCTSAHYTLLVHTGQTKSARSNPQKLNLHHNTREKCYMNVGRPSAALFTIYGLLTIKESTWSVHLESPCRLYTRQTSGTLFHHVWL